MSVPWQPADPSFVPSSSPIRHSSVDALVAPASPVQRNRAFLLRSGDASSPPAVRQRAPDSPPSPRPPAVMKSQLSESKLTRLLGDTPPTTAPISPSQATKLAQLLGPEITPALVVRSQTPDASSPPPVRLSPLLSRSDSALSFPSSTTSSSSSSETLSDDRSSGGPHGFLEYISADEHKPASAATPKSSAQFFLSRFLALDSSPPPPPSADYGQHMQRILAATAAGDVLVLAQLLQSLASDPALCQHVQPGGARVDQRKSRAVVSALKRSNFGGSPFGSRGSSCSCASSPCRCRSDHDTTGDATDDGSDASVYPMHVAAARGHLEAVMLLSRSGCFSVDAYNDAGQTPLIVAADSFHLKICDLLIKYGANIGAVDRRSGANFLHFLARHSDDVVATTPADYLLPKLFNVVAAASGLSLVDGVDSNGDTPLHTAVHSRAGTLIRHLLRAGARTDLRNAAGATPQDAAHAAALPSDLLALFQPDPRQHSALPADTTGSGGVSLANCKLAEYPYALLQKLCAQLGTPVERLELSFNAIADIHEHQFFMQNKTLGLDHSLQTLLLHHNALSSLPRTLSTLKHLAVLDVSYNQLTELPGTLASCEQLRFVNVSHNRIARLPHWLGALRQLDTLLCHDNPLVFPPADVASAPLDQLLDYLRTASRSQRSSLLSLPAVEGVDLRSENLTRFPYDELRQLALLNEQQSPDEQGLHLSHNQIMAIDEGQFFLTFRDAQKFRDSIRLLALNHNFLTSLPRSVSILRQLRVLNLSHNQLTSLPGTVGTLVQLHTLDLSFNCLRSLPAELTGCTALEQLNLACNPSLSFPPAEIIKQGARAVLEALNLWDQGQLVCVMRGNTLFRLRPKERPSSLHHQYQPCAAMLAEVRARSLQPHGYRHAFRLLLGHPEGRQLFLEFLKSEFSDENLRFLDDVELFRRNMHDASLLSVASSIFAQYFDFAAPDCINISDANRIAVQLALSEAIDSPDPLAVRAIFDAAAQEIELVLENDSFRRFLVTLNDS